MRRVGARRIAVEHVAVLGAAARAGTVADRLRRRAERAVLALEGEVAGVPHPGGARGRRHAEEVLDEGDDAQRQQAQQLLDSLPT